MLHYIKSISKAKTAWLFSNTFLYADRFQNLHDQLCDPHLMSDATEVTKSMETHLKHTANLMIKMFWKGIGYQSKHQSFYSWYFLAFWIHIIMLFCITYQIHQIFTKNGWQLILKATNRGRWNYYIITDI